MPDVRTNETSPRARTQLFSALAFAVPVALIAYWNALHSQALTLADFFVAPLLVGGALIFWLLYLHFHVCRDDVVALGLRKPRPSVDVLLGIGLAAGLLAFHATFGVTAARVLPPRPPVPQVLTLIGTVSHSPWLLALWLGPVVWIGVAAFEELGRVFLLRRISLIIGGTGGLWTAIVVVSCFFGLVHAYQGAAAVVSITLQSVPLGWVYFRTGRVRALIMAHALYDSAQIVMAVVTMRQLGL